MTRFKKFILGITIFYICEFVIITPFPIGGIFNFDSRSFYHNEPIKFSPQDKILIVSPHPDDAVLSSSGVIQKALRKGARVKVVYVTYGSHNETSIIKDNKLKLLTPLGAIDLGKKRHNEAVSATGILGLKKSNLVFLGFPDFGTLKMWTDYFQGKSYFSGLTFHNRVFYKNAFEFGTLFQGREELISLRNIIKDYSPTKIFYPSLLDLNSDHRATGLFLKAALSDLKIHPSLYSYLVHAENWPQPYGYFPNSPFSLPNYIEWFPRDTIYTIHLTHDEELFKQEAIEAHKSQLISNKNFMYSFVKNNEVFFSPSVYAYNEHLPLWKPKVLQEIGVIPYIKSVVLTTDNQYYYYNINFYPGIPLYTKINLFVYEKNYKKLFQDSPHYRFIIGRSVINNKLYYKIENNNRFIDFQDDDFKANLKKDVLTIRIQKRYFNQTDFILSSLEIEKGDVRVAETPWWEIKI